MRGRAERILSQERGRAATLRDSVDIDAAPERVWDWLCRMADQYTDWHPAHVEAEWIVGTPNQVGSRMRAVEILGGHQESLILQMTNVEPPNKMEYRICGAHRLLLPGGRFLIEARPKGSVFTAEIDVRWATLVSNLLRKRMETIRTHMRQEGESLKRLLEADHSPTP